MSKGQGVNRKSSQWPKLEHFEQGKKKTKKNLRNLRHSIFKILEFILTYMAE